MSLITTLAFYGQTEDASNFYREAVGAEILFLMRFRDSPDPAYLKPGVEDKIFHATFQINESAKSGQPT